MNANDNQVRGRLIFLGGGQGQLGAPFDTDLFGADVPEAVILPTAAAYERPEREVEKASTWFSSFGIKARPLMVLRRTDAENEDYAAIVRQARVIYLSGGSPLHLKAVMKDSVMLQALMSAWHNGAVIAGSSAGAVVLTDPMVDPRGGAFTVGFGLVRDVAIVPHYPGDLTAQLRRTLSLAPSGCPVVALGEGAALIRDPDGIWRLGGHGPSALYLDGEQADLDVLAGKSVG